MKNMSQKLILFDIDKTLIDKMVRTFDPWRAAFKAVYGIDAGIDSAELLGAPQKQIVLVSMKKAGLSTEEIEAKMEHFFQVLESFYKDCLKDGEIVLFPKTVEMLEALRLRGYLLGLVTGNTKSISFLKLDRAEIGKYFDVGGYGDDAYERSELVSVAIQRAEEKLGVKLNKEDVFVVGDSVKDMEAAKPNGVKAIGVTTGKFSREDLVKAGADTVLENLENIDDLLAALA